MRTMEAGCRRCMAPAMRGETPSSVCGRIDDGCGRFVPPLEEKPVAVVDRGAGDGVGRLQSKPTPFLKRPSLMLSFLMQPGWGKTSLVSVL